MRWLCVQDFGLHKRGEFVVLPDDAEASPQYFVRAPEDEEPTPAAAEEAPDVQGVEEGSPVPPGFGQNVPPTATDEATGATEPTDDLTKSEG